MKRQGGGRVVNFADWVAASGRPRYKGYLSYYVAKAGVIGLMIATVGTDPRFVAAVRDLVLERAAVVRGEERERRALGALGPSHDVCPAGCCPNERDPGRPALCGVS